MAIGIACNAKHKEHTSTQLYDMKLLTIYQIIKLQTGIFMYKAFHMKLPYNLQAHFVVAKNNYEIKARQSSSFRQIYVRIAKKQHCVSVIGINYGTTLKNSLDSKTERIFSNNMQIVFNNLL